mmetsp:Transcript_27198/g.54480  ORF Transcript_27198/g.54480 Transcript_27198/m.54480 type:complete len:430 (-) Transcript_27198:1934-3223(-)
MVFNTARGSALGRFASPPVAAIAGRFCVSGATATGAEATGPAAPATANGGAAAAKASTRSRAFLRCASASPQINSRLEPASMAEPPPSSRTIKTLSSRSTGPSLSGRKKAACASSTTMIVTSSRMSASTTLSTRPRPVAAPPRKCAMACCMRDLHAQSTYSRPLERSAGKPAKKKAWPTICATQFAARAACRNACCPADEERSQSNSAVDPSCMNACTPHRTSSSVFPSRASLSASSRAPVHSPGQAVSEPAKTCKTAATRARSWPTTASTRAPRSQAPRLPPATLAELPPAVVSSRGRTWAASSSCSLPSYSHCTRTQPSASPAPSKVALCHASAQFASTDAPTSLTAPPEIMMEPALPTAPNSPARGMTSAPGGNQNAKQRVSSSMRLRFERAVPDTLVTAVSGTRTLEQQSPNSSGISVASPKGPA